MSRAYFIILSLALLTACATEQPQAAANAQQPLNAPPPAKSVADCLRESSIVGAWSCVTKDKPSQ